jgi:hypothetical protein
MKQHTTLQTLQNNQVTNTELNNSTEHSKLLMQLATLNIETFLTEHKELNSPATANEILTTIEKLAMLKNCKFDEYQETAIIQELQKHKFTREQLLAAYQRILPLSLWNNELNLEHFLQIDNSYLNDIAKKAQQMLHAMISEKETQIKYYPTLFFPYDMIELYLQRNKELESLKKKLMKEFEETLNDALCYDEELLKKYISPAELKMLKKQLQPNQSNND